MLAQHLGSRSREHGATSTSSHGEITAYFNRKGIILRNEIDLSMPRHKSHAWVVRIREAAPPELPAMAGDVSHNLRATLGLLACDIPRRVDVDVKLKGVSFPFSRAENDLDQVIGESGLRRAGTEAVRLLKALEPCNGGNTALRAIHDLDIQDQHTGLLLVAQDRRIPGNPA